MHDPLKLENQLCFSLYTGARSMVRKYKPFLDPLNITYTQYICLLVLWEKDKISVKELGERLVLDSGTLTPLIKKLETQGLLRRVRQTMDERMISIELTEKGLALKDDAKDIPFKIVQCLNIDIKQAIQLKETLDLFIEKNPT
ncbi:MAG TPA: MarR family transcriptional regulator [Erysipelotrichaceae bacterium]|nr:MarR family transcriptional regulator [Erysipelotrichaceae bacterium]